MANEVVSAEEGPWGKGSGGPVMKKGDATVAA
jgi:hypothetical protein